MHINEAFKPELDSSLELGPLNLTGLAEDSSWTQVVERLLRKTTMELEMELKAP